MTTFKHMVVYVGRSSVFTDQRFTDKLRKTLQTHEEYGWELVNVASRSGPLGDVSGMWMFFKRAAEAEAAGPDLEQIQAADEAAA
jgi:pyruvate/2-oxoacid:ferredoxin oxidoreductase beta subunit